LQEDPKWELAILATVHGFYQKLLREHFAGEVPTPEDLNTHSLSSGTSNVSEALVRMRRWLQLLDLAISPAMVRCGLTPETDPEIAEGLLRYYARKSDRNETDRDKTDLVATFLYRYPRVPGQWERRGYALDGTLPAPPFEIALTEILADGDVPLLSVDDTHKLADLDLMRAQAEVFRDFGAFLDSGLTLRVRSMKRALGDSFYHPAVLAYIAPFNAAYGKKFDTLFRAVSFEIKKFAQSIEQRGGSIVGQVDGMDVTVDLVAGMDEEEILSTDYGASLERFRRVSKLKKSLETQPKKRAAAVASPGGSARGTHTVKAAPFVHGRLSHKAPSSRKRVAHSAALAGQSKEVVSADPRQITLEETRLRSVEESIRAFVRAASPKLREIVPMRFFNLILTAAEADAFCADYLEEDSFRAECARILVRAVAVVARMSTEIEELKRQRFTSQAKPHGQALLLLLEPARIVKENADLVLKTAAQRGLTEKVITMKASLQKLRERSELAEKALAELPVETAVQ